MIRSSLFTLVLGTLVLLTAPGLSMDNVDSFPPRTTLLVCADAPLVTVDDVKAFASMHVGSPPDILDGSVVLASDLGNDVTLAYVGGPVQEDGNECLQRHRPLLEFAVAKSKSLRTEIDASTVFPGLKSGQFQLPLLYTFYVEAPGDVLDLYAGFCIDQKRACWQAVVPAMLGLRSDFCLQRIDFCSTASTPHVRQLLEQRRTR